jgi:hypothetical protein
MTLVQNEKKKFLSMFNKRKNIKQADLMKSRSYFKINW